MRRRTAREARTRLLFLTPGLALVALIFLYPVYRLVRTSLEQSLGDITINVGLDNFRIVIDDPVFRSAVMHNLYLLACVPFMVIWALLLALILFEQRHAARVFQFLIFVPYIISIPVIGIAFSEMLTKHGALNAFLGSIGLGGLEQDWLGDRRLALFTLVVIIVWRESTLGAVFILARLLALPPELLEAAKVDGASWLRMHWHVTLPQIRGIIGLYSVLAVITVAVWVFSYVFVLTNGGPGNATITTDLYIYQAAFTSSDFNIAAAASTLVLCVTAVIILAASLTRRLRLS